MNALRQWSRFLWAQHVRLWERVTPRQFAFLWGGIAGGTFVGALLSPTPAAGLGCAVVGMVACAMAWANATGRIHP